MKIKELIKSYGFWTALSGAMVVLVQALSKAFGFTIENKVVSDIIMAIAGVLVVFGVVSMPAEKLSAMMEETKDEEERSQEKKSEDEDEKS